MGCSTTKRTFQNKDGPLFFSGTTSFSDMLRDEKPVYYVKNNSGKND
jgi:hypothetical protein